MKQFAIAALAAVPALAQWQWSTFDILENDGIKNKYARTTPTSVFEVKDDNLHLESNKSVFIMDDVRAQTNYHYKPWLIGGSVQITTNVNQIESGCVSGLYLVKTGPECGMDEQTGEPKCPTIDVLQSNKYDLNMQAHPCANGNCDAASQCSYSMMKDGAEKYGQNAYGVGGDIICTSEDFDVKTEFISDPAYKKVFKIKTTLSQEGRSMELEADCSEYLSGLSFYLGMEMGLVVSHWQDDEGVSGLESNTEFVGCNADKKNMIGGIRTNWWGSTEDKDDGDDGDDDGDEDGETIFTDIVAQQVDDCGNPDCTECVEAYKEFKPDDRFLACKSETQFRYKFKCGTSKDQSRCGADDYCHWSYPMGDPEKFRSSDAACRPIPDKLVFNDFTYADVEWRNPRAGLCRYGCDEGQQCRKSWLPTDSRKGYSSLQRCMYMDD